MEVGSAGRPGLSPAPALTSGLKRLEIQAGWDSSIVVLYGEPLGKQA